MSVRFEAMGCEILVEGADAAALEAIRALMADADRRFSRFIPDSELNRVNAQAGSSTMVSEPFAAMLAAALSAAALTDGLVDPTLGAAVVAAGYDRDFALVAPEGPAVAAGPSGRFRSVRQTGPIIEFPADVQLDLNGVVKARAIDAAAALLPGDGWIAAGGDIATRGPVDASLPGGGAVRLESGGLATSGRSKRRWRRGGVEQHHLIDPRTGAPSRSRWLDVTACAASCYGADIAAKAAFLLDADGPEWLDAHGMPGRFLDADGAVVENAAWRAAVPEAACSI